MKRIAWLTDIHLNFLSDAGVDEFLASVALARPDAVLVGGDIGESPDICDYLERMRRILRAPIYFVLGNHDFYRGSIAETRRRVAQFCADRAELCYLTTQDSAIELTSHVGLVGHDGWADGRAGDFARSTVSITDYRLIAELSSLDASARLQTLHLLGDEAARHVCRVLPPAFERFRDVVLLTHVPPLREACWYDGRLSDDQWAPHFTCQAMGKAILEIMAARPRHRLTVLCGHTHGHGETQPALNVQIITGGTDYGHPTIQRLLEFD